MIFSKDCILNVTVVTFGAIHSTQGKLKSNHDFGCKNLQFYKPFPFQNIERYLVMTI